MRVAIIGSRDVLDSDYSIVCKYIPANASEIVSGGAVGIDAMAKKYALENNLKLKEFFPDYSDESLTNKKLAPLKRNCKIVNYADYVLAFWNGYSNGTGFVIEYCVKKNKPVKVIMLDIERSGII